MSPKYSLNEVDLKKIGTAIFYSIAAAVISTLIVVVGDMDFGTYAFLIPTINTVLYTAQKFVAGR